MPKITSQSVIATTDHNENAAFSIIATTRHIDLFADDDKNDKGVAEMDVHVHDPEPVW